MVEMIKCADDTKDNVAFKEEEMKMCMNQILLDIMRFARVYRSHLAIGEATMAKCTVLSLPLRAFIQ